MELSEDMMQMLNRGQALHDMEEMHWESHGKPCLTCGDFRSGWRRRPVRWLLGRATAPSNRLPAQPSPCPALVLQTDGRPCVRRSRCCSPSSVMVASMPLHRYYAHPTVGERLLWRRRRRNLAYGRDALEYTERENDRLYGELSDEAYGGGAK